MGATLTRPCPAWHFDGVCPQEQRCHPVDLFPRRLVLNSEVFRTVQTRRPMGRLLNYLLSYRKRSALSQVDVAFLLGVHSSAKVCKHERFTQEPSLQTALAYEAIYRKPVSELFPGLFEKVQAEVKARAGTMEHMTFARNSAPIAKRKRETIATITRIGNRQQ
jgi:DNA-binding XRE family transcriptional regulator